MVVELFIICVVDLFVKRFDGELRRTFESDVGFVLSDSQWEQAALPVKGSGLGLRRAADLADAAYISSRCDTFDDCLSIDGKHVWDNGSVREDSGEDVLGE